MLPKQEKMDTRSLNAKNWRPINLTNRRQKHKRAAHKGRASPSAWLGDTGSTCVTLHIRMTSVKYTVERQNHYFVIQSCSTVGNEHFGSPYTQSTTLTHQWEEGSLTANQMLLPHPPELSRPLNCVTGDYQTLRGKPQLTVC